MWESIEKESKGIEDMVLDGMWSKGGTMGKGGVFFSKRSMKPKSWVSP